jgi:hypothetical protein
MEHSVQSWTTVWLESRFEFRMGHGLCPHFSMLCCPLKVKALRRADLLPEGLQAKASRIHSFRIHYKWERMARLIPESRRSKIERRECICSLVSRLFTQLRSWPRYFASLTPAVLCLMQKDLALYFSGFVFFGPSLTKTGNCRQRKFSFTKCYP